jgi:hypothetical protein
VGASRLEPAPRAVPPPAAGTPAPAEQPRAAAAAASPTPVSRTRASQPEPEPEPEPVAEPEPVVKPVDAGPEPEAKAPGRRARAAPVDAPPAPDSAAPPEIRVPPVEGDLATLRDRWPEVVARISAHPPTKPLIAACRPVSVEDGVVTLGFPEDQGFLSAVAERRRNVLEENIGAVLGRPVAVRCVATNLDLVPEVSTDGDADFLLKEARRIFGADAEESAEVS